MWKTLGMVLAAAAAVALLVILRGGDAPTGVEGGAVGRAARSVDEPHPRPPAVDLNGGGAERGREAAPAAGQAARAEGQPEPAEAIAPTDHEALLVRGRVLDVLGAPMSGFELRGVSGHGAALATTDVAGSFELTASEVSTLTLRADRPGWVTVRMSVVDAWSEDQEHVVVVSPAVDLAGRVVDVGGVGVRGARLVVEFPDEALARFPLPIDRARRTHFRADSRAEGRFELDAVPCADGARLVVHADGYEDQILTVPRDSESNLVLELTLVEPDRGDEPRIVGTVVLPERTAAAGATVVFASAEATTDESGRFEIPVGRLLSHDETSPLVAVLEGHGPAVLEDYGALVIERTADMNDLPSGGVIDDALLVLGDGTLEIAGHVVDAAGERLEGWQVSLADPTEISRGRVPPVLAENLGRTEPEDVTDADGSFVLAGLLAREYRLKAYDPGTLLQVETEPVLAGRTNVQIEVPDGLLHEALEGRVVSRSGRPVVGAAVSVGLETFRSGGAVGWTSTVPVATDADGRFVLADVPRRGVRLDVGGEDVVPTTHEVPEHLTGELLLSVPRRCHFRVSVDGSDLTSLSIGALDADGVPQGITTFTASGYGSSTAKPLDEGTMGVCAISEDVRVIVLQRDHEEIARQDVVLDPDLVNEVRFTLP